MSTVVVVGAQWGDEGKGKVVDYLAAHFDIVARYAGGHNAGHTIVVGGRRTILQLIPSGILHPGKWAVIGSGVVLDPRALLGELAELEKNGVQAAGRLFISNRAHLIFPFHAELERAAEAALGPLKIGTTARGIGPTYEDKMGRRGLRTCDLLDPERFEQKLRFLLDHKRPLARALYGQAELNSASVLEQYKEYAER
ncbi:MAG: adenylosuccinate synthetase, partial [Terriglobia bacterium]